jgi:hypothetical protein
MQDDRKGRRQVAVDGKGLTVDIRCRIAREKQSHLRNLVGRARAALGGVFNTRSW